MALFVDLYIEARCIQTLSKGREGETLLKLYARGATIVLYVYALRGYTEPFQLKLSWGAEREKK